MYHKSTVILAMTKINQFCHTKTHSLISNSSNRSHCSYLYLLL